MFHCISKFFATLTSLFNTVHIISTVGEDYAQQFKDESNFNLEQKRRELKRQVELENAAS